MPQSWDMGQILSLPHRRKACGGFFRCPKNRTTSAGFEPANSGTRGQHANYNNVQPDSSQMTIGRMHIACWFPKATNAHSGYSILPAFPLQQWLYKRPSVLRCRYIPCLVYSLLSYSGVDIYPVTLQHPCGISKQILDTAEGTHSLWKRDRHLQ
jgi:hypothetical protein